MKIEPDKQFVATAESLSAILNQYGLDYSSHLEASSGIENCTSIVKTRQGDYVVRVYRQGNKNLEEINVEVDFVNYLRPESRNLFKIKRAFVTLGV